MSIMLRESGCQLTCLSLWGFKYHKWKDHCCDFLSLSIEKFLRFQTRLQYFEISWNLPLCYGVHLLEALAQQCSITVNNLLLIDFCDPRRQVYKNVAYQDLMRRWDHLNSISLSYNAISEEVILTLAKSNGLILKHLSVECCYWNARTHSISSSVWLEVKKLAPNLQVDFLLMEIPKFSDIQELLPNGMPLRKLTFNTGYNVEERTYWNLNSFIKYISNNFCNSLEILKLFIENNSEIDESIVYLMISCRNVKSLKICAMLKLQTIDSLCKLREENKLGQEILHLDVRDLDMPSEERNDILCIEELLQTKIEIQGFTLRIHVY